MGGATAKPFLRPAADGSSAAQTGTWAFLFSDIEGSTRLLLRLGDRYDEILEQHRAIVRAAIAKHGGDEQGTEGDSFVVAFRDVTSAALTAIEAQRGLSQARWLSGVELKVRMGIHVGEARLDPVGGFNGLTLHATARVMGAAHGGQIVVSRPCVDLLAAEVARTRLLGSFHLKDLPAPLELYQLVAPGLETEFPPLRGTGSVRGTTRRRVRTPLRGRQRELDRVEAQLAEPGLVTLIGPAGTGKTRLTVEALDVVDPTGANSLFVDLAVVADVERAIWRVADALGIEGEDDALEAVVAAIGSSRPSWPSITASMCSAVSSLWSRPFWSGVRS